MKKLLLFALLFCLMNTMANAQCIPDPIYKDSSFGVYPKPYEPTLNPKGGINKSACIGKPYKYIFTAKIPDTTNVNTPFGPVLAKIDSVKLDKKDPATIQGLPVGITYACDPPNCVFFPKKPACLYLYGTATAANKAGDYELKITTKGFVNVAGFSTSAAISFPDKTIAPGTYILKLEPTTSTTCFVSDAKDKNENIVHIGANPNPTNDFTTIAFYALAQDKFEFVVMDMTGKIVHQENRSVEAGINTINFDAANLAAGVYIYYLGNNKGKATNRLVVNR